MNYSGSFLLGVKTRGPFVVEGSVGGEEMKLVFVCHELVTPVILSGNSLVSQLLCNLADHKSIFISRNNRVSLVLAECYTYSYLVPSCFSYITPYSFVGVDKYMYGVSFIVVVATDYTTTPIVPYSCLTN